MATRARKPKKPSPYGRWESNGVKFTINRKTGKVTKRKKK